jgi:hypothetical protein
MLTLQDLKEASAPLALRSRERIAGREESKAKFRAWFNGQTEALKEMLARSYELCEVGRSVKLMASVLPPSAETGLPARLAIRSTPPDEGEKGCEGWAALVYDGDDVAEAGVSWTDLIGEILRSGGIACRVYSDGIVLVPGEQD